MLVNVAGKLSLQLTNFNKTSMFSSEKLKMSPVVTIYACNTFSRMEKSVVFCIDSSAVKTIVLEWKWTNTKENNALDK